MSADEKAQIEAEKQKAQIAAEKHRKRQRRYIATHPVVYDDRRREIGRKAAAAWRARQKLKRAQEATD